MQSRKAMLIILAALNMVSAAALAHHAFSSVFNRENPFEITGTVTKVDWRNPHTWIFVDVANDDGAVESWGFEMGSPNALVRRGWSHDTLTAGQVVTIAAARARDGSMRGAVRSVTLPNGDRLFGAQDESR